MIDRTGWVLAGLGIAAVAAFALWSYREWPGQWPWTIDAVNGSTVLSGPLAGAVAAAFQLNASRVADLADAAPRGWLVPVRSAWSASCTAAAVLAATAVTASSITVLGPHGGPIEWWALLVGLLTLSMCSLAGALAAFRVPQRAVVLAVPVGLFLLGTFGPSPVPDLFRHGPSTGTLAGLTWAPEVLASRVLALGAVCSCLVVAMLPWRRGHGRRLRVATAVMAAVGLVAGVVCLELAGSERWKASAEQPTQCRGRAPAVCVSGSSVRHLAATYDAVRRPADLLVAAGAPLPRRFDEELPHRRGHPDHGVLQPVTGRVDARDGAALLTRPAPCPQWSDPAGPPASEVFEAEQVLMEWVAHRAGDRPRAFDPEMEAWLPRIGSEETAAWVVRTYRALRECDFAAVTVPWAR